MSNELRQTIRKCTRCHLYKAHNGPVPGLITKPYGLLVIGEAPGHEEDIGGKVKEDEDFLEHMGMPFVGRSGRFLRMKLREAHVPARYTSFANAISCRPTEKRGTGKYSASKDRPPRPDELAACRTNLIAQVAAANPRIVLTVGAISSKLFYTNIKLVNDHGRPVWLAKNRIQIPTYHPAFILRKQSEMGHIFADDLRQMAKRLYEGVNINWPDDCRECKKPVEKYDRWGLAYCDEHYTEPSTPVREHGLFEGIL